MIPGNEMKNNSEANQNSNHDIKFKRRKRAMLKNFCQPTISSYMKANSSTSNVLPSKHVQSNITTLTNMTSDKIHSNNNASVRADPPKFVNNIKNIKSKTELSRFVARKSSLTTSQTRQIKMQNDEQKSAESDKKPVFKFVKFVKSESKNAKKVGPAANESKSDWLECLEGFEIKGQVASKSINSKISQLTDDATNDATMEDLKDDSKFDAYKNNNCLKNGNQRVAAISYEEVSDNEESVESVVEPNKDIENNDDDEKDMTVQNVKEVDVEEVETFNDRKVKVAEDEEKMVETQKCVKLNGEITKVKAKKIKHKKGENMGKNKLSPVDLKSKNIIFSTVNNHSSVEDWLENHCLSVANSGQMLNSVENDNSQTVHCEVIDETMEKTKLENATSLPHDDKIIESNVIVEKVKEVSTMQKLQMQTHLVKIQEENSETDGDNDKSYNCVTPTQDLAAKVSDTVKSSSTLTKHDKIQNENSSCYLEQSVNAERQQTVSTIQKLENDEPSKGKQLNIRESLKNNRYLKNKDFFKVQSNAALENSNPKSVESDESNSYKKVKFSVFGNRSFTLPKQELSVNVSKVCRLPFKRIENFSNQAIKFSTIPTDASTTDLENISEQENEINEKTEQPEKNTTLTKEINDRVKAMKFNQNNSENSQVAEQTKQKKMSTFNIFDEEKIIGSKYGRYSKEATDFIPKKIIFTTYSENGKNIKSEVAKPVASNDTIDENPVSMDNGVLLMKHLMHQACQETDNTDTEAIISNFFSSRPLQMKGSSRDCLLSHIHSNRIKFSQVNNCQMNQNKNENAYQISSDRETSASRFDLKAYERECLAEQFPLDLGGLTVRPFSSQIRHRDKKENKKESNDMPIRNQSINRSLSVPRKPFSSFPSNSCCNLKNDKTKIRGSSIYFPSSFQTLQNNTNEEVRTDNRRSHFEQLPITLPYEAQRFNRLQQLQKYQQQQQSKLQNQQQNKQMVHDQQELEVEHHHTEQQQQQQQQQNCEQQQDFQEQHQIQPQQSQLHLQLTHQIQTQQQQRKTQLQQQQHLLLQQQHQQQQQQQQNRKQQQNLQQIQSQQSQSPLQQANQVQIHQQQQHRKAQQPQQNQQQQNRKLQQIFQLHQIQSQQSQLHLQQTHQLQTQQRKVQQHQQQTNQQHLPKEIYLQSHSQPAIETVSHIHSIFSQIPGLLVDYNNNNHDFYQTGDNKAITCQTQQQKQKQIIQNECYTLRLSTSGFYEAQSATPSIDPKEEWLATIPPRTQEGRWSSPNWFDNSNCVTPVMNNTPQNFVPQTPVQEQSESKTVLEHTEHYCQQLYQQQQQQQLQQQLQQLQQQQEQLKHSKHVQSSQPILFQEPSECQNSNINAHAQYMHTSVMHHINDVNNKRVDLGSSMSVVSKASRENRIKFSIADNKCQRKMKKKQRKITALFNKKTVKATDTETETDDARDCQNRNNPSNVNRLKTNSTSPVSSPSLLYTEPLQKFDCNYDKIPRSNNVKIADKCYSDGRKNKLYGLDKTMEPNLKHNKNAISPTTTMSTLKSADSKSQVISSSSELSPRKRNTIKKRQKSLVTYSQKPLVRNQLIPSRTSNKFQQGGLQQQRFDPTDGLNSRIFRMHENLPEGCVKYITC